MTPTLSNSERGELRSAERVIAAGIQTVLAVGRALAAIGEKKLYRATHATFADYCAERWGIQKSRAYQLIDAAGTAENLSTMVERRRKTPAKPRNERQIRALRKVPAALQKRAWQAATKAHPQPTGRDVAQRTLCWSAATARSCVFPSTNSAQGIGNSFA